MFTDIDVPLTLNTVNRAHRIGPRTSITNRQHSRHVIIQFIDQESKTTFMKARKHLRGKQLSVFISEDLTQKRARLFYVCREKSENTCFRTAGPMMGESSPMNRTAELKQSFVRKT